MSTSTSVSTSNLPYNIDVVDAFPKPAGRLPAALRELNGLRRVVAHPSASALARFEQADVVRLASVADQFVVGLRGQARNAGDGGSTSCNEAHG